MKALVFNGPKDIRYEDFPDPKLASDNSVILKVGKCSICGSDLHMYHGENIGQSNYGGDVDRFCVGHEFIGEVVETGPTVQKFSVGDKVISAAGAGCGNCGECLIGNVRSCRNRNVFGLSARLNGGQAQYVNVPNADLTMILRPEGVSDDQAILMTDAMGTAFFGVNRCAISPGDGVAVVGLGPIGIIGVELAFILGASRVFAVDPVEARRRQAEQLGATPLRPEVALEAVQEATKGRRAKCVFEASGAKSAVGVAIALAGRGSTVSFVGLPQPDITLPMADLLFRDITIRAGVANPSGQWPHLIALMQNGRLKADGLFSHRMPLSEGAEAYRIFNARKDGVVKIMMDVT